MPKAAKTLFAFVLMIASVALGLPMMLQGESNVNLKAEDMNDLSNITQMVDDGLKPYFMGLGVVFFLIGLAFVLVDGEDKVSTFTGAEEDWGKEA